MVGWLLECSDKQIQDNTLEINVERSEILYKYFYLELHIRT